MHVAILAKEWSINETKFRLQQSKVIQNYEISESRFLKTMKVVPTDD